MNAWLLVSNGLRLLIGMTILNLLFLMAACGGVDNRGDAFDVPDRDVAESDVAGQDLVAFDASGDGSSDSVISDTADDAVLNDARHDTDVSDSNGSGDCGDLIEPDYGFIPVPATASCQPSGSVCDSLDVVQILFKEHGLICQLDLFRELAKNVRTEPPLMYRLELQVIIITNFLDNWFLR